MPRDQSIPELFTKYINGECSVEENAFLFERIADKEYDEEVSSLLDAELRNTTAETDYNPAWERTLLNIKSKAGLTLTTGTEGTAETSTISYPTKRTMRLWSTIAKIAAVVFVIFGIYFFNAYQKEPNYEHLTANDIPPGKIGATLTLANGKKISLTDAANGEIINESGLSISKTENGQIVYHAPSGQSSSNGLNNSNARNTLTTAIGETFILTLPDQTKVWLNAASSLTYNPNLTSNGIRKVKLTGEGYFEVAKDKDHPFIVESGNQSVEVLGTHFNVHAYPDEKAYRTTLLEGSIKITDQGQSKVLAPGDQVSNSSGHIKLTQVDPEFAVAWKSNNFVFDRLDIKEIMKMISRWYNVEVIYKEDIPSGTFWGSVSRFDNISKVLIPLEATGDVHFKIEGRKIYVLR
jgi:transmembrane sensor